MRFVPWAQTRQYVTKHWSNQYCTGKVVDPAELMNANASHQTQIFLSKFVHVRKYSKGLHNAHMTIVTRLKTETRMNQYFHQPQTSTIKLVNVVFWWLNMAQYKYYLFASLLDDWVPAARETELVECIGRALHKVGVLKFAPAVCALQQWCPISLSKNSGARKRPEYNHLLSTQHHPWPHCLSLTPGRVGYPADIDTP